jgi:hypothetical protein
MNLPASAACLPLLLAACASAPPVPAAIDSGADEAPALTVGAAGVQIYECRNPAAGGTPQWVFVAPEAQLFDGQRRPVGRHGAGPVWLADDGSRLKGSVKARADAASAGGVAPAGGCTPGATARTPYTADYRLFRRARWRRPP